MQRKTIINFTPTGMIPQKETVPFVPISPYEIIEEVHQACELGITMVHLHARKPNGVPSSLAADYAPIVEGIRTHCPDLVICTSLSGRTVSDPMQRAEVLSLGPDMGSLTLSSLNFAQKASVNSPETIQYLAAEMSRVGVKPELEVFDIGMMNYLNYLIKKQKLTPPFYINIILNNIAGLQATPAHLGAVLGDAPSDSYIGLGGIGSSQLDAHLMALSQNLGVRIGLEDNIHFDRNRTVIASNTSLLRRLHQVMELCARDFMEAKEFGALGFYNKANK